MRISDWSSDVCSSDLPVTSLIVRIVALAAALPVAIFSSSLLAQENGSAVSPVLQVQRPKGADQLGNYLTRLAANPRDVDALIGAGESALQLEDPRSAAGFFARADAIRSEEHTSELQSLMRISYAVFCLKKKKTKNK